MEVYVDDILVKSLNKADHIKHLHEAFEVLRHHIMILNHVKCAFGVGSGKFLGLMVSKWGIESFYMDLRRWKTREAIGWTSYSPYYRHIEPPAK